MAYGKKYDIDYKSMADEDYTLEFWVDGWAGSSTEINLGSSGPEIKYETSGQEKFTYILASSLEIPFIVEDIGMQDFITDLQDGTYEEKDVYVHLFNSRDTTKPLWSGFILMDLAAKEDVSFPYEVKLTAIDGLSLLKDRPFVRDTNTDTGAAVVFPYEKEDVYWNNYDKITDWIQIILAKTGASTTTEGVPSGGSYTYKTSINWYNSTMPSAGQADDPLAWTQCKMNSVYDRDENGKYTPKSTYEVLESLCKVWGMRCVYWNNCFHFVQIPEYETNESGTTASPINISTREYYHTGSVRGDAAYIGSTNLGRYDLQFENITNVNNAGLQKLAGTQYENYAPIKKIITDFSVLADENRFFGFPAMDQTTNTGDLIASSEISTYTDAADNSGWFCQIPLNFSNISSELTLGGGSFPRTLDMKLCFSIRAREAGTTPYTKMLTESGSTLSWVAYTAPTGSNNVPDDMINANVTNIDIGTSQRIIWDSTGYTNGVIPTDAAFTGDWEFEFFTYTQGAATIVNYHGKLSSPSNGNWGVYRAGTTNTTFDYSDVYDSNNDFMGLFAQVTGGAIGANSTLSEFITAASDSYSRDITGLYWGDSPLIDNPSALRVWNGSAFVKANAAGKWGKGIITGTTNFTVLLANEIMKSQDAASYRMNVSSALSETDKEDSGKLKMVNPIGRLKDVNSQKYVFLSGTFSTLRDEWNGVWFQQTYNSGISITRNTEENYGLSSGNITGGGNQGSLLGQGSQQMVVPWGASQISSRITAGAVTTLNITPVGDTIIFTNDIIYVTDNKSQQRVSFTVASNVGATDTTITVVSKTITNDIREGAVVGIDNENLFEQYQRKTEGTIAGMPVTSDSIGKYSFKGGIYSIVGVDTNFVKVLPRDFMINDDGSNEALEFKDGVNTGLTVGDAGQEMIATVNIPSGTTATEVTIWGSASGKVVEVYEASVASNGIGSAIGTGTTNGSPISITATAATTTNYLLILVKVTATSNRIYGGKVTLTQN